jgi:hypothetical protein
MRWRDYEDLYGETREYLRDELPAARPAPCGSCGCDDVETPARAACQLCGEETCRACEDFHAGEECVEWVFKLQGQRRTA